MSTRDDELRRIDDALQSICDCCHTHPALPDHPLCQSCFLAGALEMVGDRIVAEGHYTSDELEDAKQVWRKTLYRLAAFSRGDCDVAHIVAVLEAAGVMYA